MSCPSTLGGSSITAELCNCMYNSLSCTAYLGLTPQTYVDILANVCANSACNGISNNATSACGAFRDCSLQQQVSWVFNEYYKAQNDNPAACVFNGRAGLETTTAVQEPRCTHLLEQVGSAGTGEITRTLFATASSSATVSSSTTTSTSTSTSTNTVSESATASTTPPLTVPTNGLNTGAKAGLGVGVAAAVLILCGVLFLFLRRRKSKDHEKTATSASSTGRFEKAELDSTARTAEHGSQAHNVDNSMNEIAGTQIYGKPTEIDSQQIYGRPNEVADTQIHEKHA